MYLIRFIKFNVAVNILLVFFISALVYDFLTIMKFISYDIGRGGQLKNDYQMRVFESVSIVINSLIIFIIALKGKIIQPFIPETVVTIFLWSLVILFLVNTIANLFADKLMEVVIFTPVTLMCALLLFRLTLEKNNQ